MRPWDDALIAILREEAERGGTWREVAARLDAREDFPRSLTTHSVTAAAHRYGILKPPPPCANFSHSSPAPEGRAVELEQDASGAVLTIRSLDVKTLEDALRVGGVDTTVWEVDRHVVNFWETTLGKKATADGQERTVTNCQVKVWLRRKTPAEKGIEAWVRRVEACARPAIPAPRGRKKGDGELLAVVGLTDHHFGMYVWGPEAGADYDLDIARRLYTEAVRASLDEGALRGNVTRVAFILGGDMFHADDTRRVTPGHENQLDADTRYEKVIDVVEGALCDAFAYAASKVPNVEGYLVPGNHDPHAARWIARLLKAHFKRTPRVTIDNSPKERKFVTHGDTLLMLTHGEKVKKPERLAVVMASEEPGLWGAARHREILRGHTHATRADVLTHSDSHGLVTIRTLPSLAARDAWHYGQGYLSNRACETHLYHQTRGHIGFFALDADELLG